MPGTRNRRIYENACHASRDGKRAKRSPQGRVPERIQRNQPPRALPGAGREEPGVTPAATISNQAGQAYAHAVQQARNDAGNGEQPSRARVRTRRFGLRLGGFGVTYTAEDVRLEPVGVPSASFGESLEAASLRRRMVLDAAGQTLSSSMPPQRRAALRAYQQAHLAADAPQRSLLGVV